MTFGMRMLLVFVLLAGVAVALTFERLPVEVVQRGYRGVGMQHVDNARLRTAALARPDVNQPPELVDPGIAEGDDTLVSAQPDVYQNVKVLGHLTTGQFNRLMVAITQWVSPDEGDYSGGTQETRAAKGCAYCHLEGEPLSADTLYTKRVARRMLQMTQHINANWKPHVGDAGVTCHTCHRGRPIPANVWYNEPNPAQERVTVSRRSDQNAPSPNVAFASLPNDAFGAYLNDRQNDIRVVSRTALPEGSDRSIKQTEWTYGLMMHMSQGLGVNCTYCHNSRAFYGWAESTPARLTAWHGIRMTRDLNVTYLDPLVGDYPTTRLGAMGDAPKANCATCHYGVFKPYYGVSVWKDYQQELAPPPGQSAGVPAPQPPPQ